MSVLRELAKMNAMSATGSTLVVRHDEGTFAFGDSARPVPKVRRQQSGGGVEWVDTQVGEYGTAEERDAAIEQYRRDNPQNRQLWTSDPIRSPYK